MGEGDAAKVAAVVLAIELEMEAGFDLMRNTCGGNLLVGVQDLPVIDFGLSMWPINGKTQLFVAVSAANPAADRFDEKDAGHWLCTLMRQFGTAFSYGA